MAKRNPSWTPEQRKAYMKAYGKKNRKKLNRNGTKYRLANIEKIRKARREAQWIAQHGNNQDAIDKVWEIQNGCCAICKCKLCKEHGKSNSCQADHDHKTSVFRGLLCRSCNWGLGHFADSPERLISATAYLGKQNGDS